VRSIVGRFLEHSRIFYYENGGKPEVFIGSGDWMSRNFFNRVEVDVPVQDPALRTRIVERILAVQLADNTNAWLLEPDGSYSRATRRDGEPRRSAQAEFMAFSLGEAGPSRRRARTLRPKLKPSQRPK